MEKSCLANTWQMGQETSPALFLGVGSGLGPHLVQEQITAAWNQPPPVPSRHSLCCTLVVSPSSTQHVPFLRQHPGSKLWAGNWAFGQLITTSQVQRGNTGWAGSGPGPVACMEDAHTPKWHSFRANTWRWPHLHLPWAVFSHLSPSTPSPHPFWSESWDLSPSMTTSTLIPSKTTSPVSDCLYHMQLRSCLLVICSSGSLPVSVILVFIHLFIPSQAALECLHHHQPQAPASQHLAKRIRPNEWPARQGPLEGEGWSAPSHFQSAHGLKKVT